MLNISGICTYKDPALLGEWGDNGPLTFLRSKKKKKENKGKKERHLKQKLIKSFHQRQNVTVLAILERLKFKKSFFLVNHGDRQYLSVLHGPSTFKLTLPVRHICLLIPEKYYAIF